MLPVLLHCVQKCCGYTPSCYGKTINFLPTLNELEPIKVMQWSGGFRPIFKASLLAYLGPLFLSQGKIKKMCCVFACDQEKIPFTTD